ncbi:MAG: C-terminal processing protease CtpA/Prc [Planctomycetota bacterium]|jgi:C-terminal processing protease CtpA/Prc
MNTQKLVTTLILLALSCIGHAQGRSPTAAPYDGIRWHIGNGVERTEIHLDSGWCELVKLDGLKAKVILDFCEKQWPRLGKKRFGEDLVEALKLMGHSPKATVELVTRDLSTGKTTTHKAVAMTHDKRQLVHASNSSAARGSRSSTETSATLPPLVEQPDSRYADLAKIPEGSAFDIRRISIDRARSDLVQLEVQLTERFSYYALTGVDGRAAIDALHFGLAGIEGGEISPSSLGLSLRKLMALFGDGHSSAGSMRSLSTAGYAPYLLEDTADGIVAFNEDRGSFLNKKYPYLLAIDGLPIEEWLEVAKRFDALGSEQLQRQRALRNLRYFNQLRSELGRSPSNKLELTLASEKGRKHKQDVLLANDRAPVYGSWPREAPLASDSRLGYLRLASMSNDAAFASALNQSMENLKGTKGLIIDVRGNGGGSRDALQTLLPYFIAPDEGSVVANVGRYRIQGGDDPNRKDGYLENRSLFPITADSWSESQRELITAFAKTFEPDWEVPMGFSAWHYMLLSHSSNSSAYHYNKPVVVLMDGACFSATDIFLGAFAERDQVTLLGTPSGGGSGRTRSVRLNQSNLKLRLSSMASFRPNGKRYDGKGIAPDVLLQPAATDWIGQSDTQLDAAIKLLTTR